MNNETDELREHVDDWEWFYQHGYLDNTFYAAGRRLHEAFMRLMETLGVVWLVGKMNAAFVWLARRLGR